MRILGKSTRFFERRKIKILVEVNYLETDSTAWTESSQTEELTKCGAGFTVSRPVEPRHLINLKLPMPRTLRLYDYGKSVYDVWGVVRSVQIVKTETVNTIRLKVGTALIGDSPPSSFWRDPTTLYDLKPVLKKSGFWDVREAPRNAGRYARSFEERRKISIAVILETIDEQGQIIESVEAETQDMSEAGMALTAKLTTEHTRYALVKTADGSRIILAKVRGFHPLEASGLAKIHLEFISGEWEF